MKMLTAEEIKAEFHALLPFDRFQLSGVQFVPNCSAPDLVLDFIEDQPTISLVIDPDVADYKVEFADTLSIEYVPEMTVSLSELFDQEFDGHALAVEKALRTVVKRNVRFEIERNQEDDKDEAVITLTLGKFATQTVCPLSDLIGFVVKE